MAFFMLFSSIQDVQRFGELLQGHAPGPGGVHCLLKVLLGLAQGALVYQLQIPRGHKAALAGNRGDEALPLQLLIGTFGGDDADPQLSGQQPHGGQSLPLPQLPPEDQALDLPGDLVIDRGVPRVAYNDVHVIPPAVSIGYIQYI